MLREVAESGAREVEEAESVRDEAGPSSASTSTRQVTPWLVDDNVTDHFHFNAAGQSLNPAGYFHPPPPPTAGRQGLESSASSDDSPPASDSDNSDASAIHEEMRMTLEELKVDKWIVDTSATMHFTIGETVLSHTGTAYFRDRHRGVMVTLNDVLLGSCAEPLNILSVIQATRRNPTMKVTYGAYSEATFSIPADHINPERVIFRARLLWKMYTIYVYRPSRLPWTLTRTR
eukprot:gene16787-23065_t